MIRTREVTVTFLEMLSLAELRPSQRRVIDFTVVRVAEPAPEFARFLYTAIGSEWYWIDRLPWALAEWQAHVIRPEVETWVGYVNGTPCGYFELECEPGPEVQVTYFGLLAAYIGRGLGGQLLTAAVQRAWALGPRRVWVHTCTLDGPTALANYQARGFRVYKRETANRELDETPPEPWPGAVRNGRSA